MSLPSTSDRKRLLLVSLFILVLFALLIAQFYKIQIVEGARWKKAADRQHKLVIAEPFKRGVFYSNTSIKSGHPEKPQALVVDVPKFHLYADPESIKPELRAEIVSQLMQILKLKPEAKNKLSAHLQKKSRSRKLVLWLSRDSQEAVARWWQPFAKKHKIARNALFFIPDYKRSYPFGKLLGQILHTVREDKDEKTHQNIATGGLELALSSTLKGKEGKRVILRSPRHPLDLGVVTVPPEHGADVYLTINHHLQAIAEEEIAKAVKNANAKSGWAIMMDPKTGEILSWAQYPFFDPSSYRTYFNDPALQSHTIAKAITDPYEPGSIMKPITLSIGLKANLEQKKRGKPPVFFPDEKVGTLAGHFPGRGKPLKDLHPHKFLNLQLALQKSSNVYMAKLVQKVTEALGDAWYRQALADCFGFGQKTGIELPAESCGLLPRPKKLHPNGKLEWSKATPYSLAMGHNVLASSLQMLRAYSVLASGGYEVNPHLVRKIVRTHEDGTLEVIADHTKPNPSRRQLLEPEIVKEVTCAMRFVTKPGGTASKADIPGYTEAGKTGTAEKIVGGVYSKKNHISTFVGYAPATDPRFVLLIAIDEPEMKYIPGLGKNQQAGVCCAPAFREIGLRTLEYLGVPKDDPNNQAWKEELTKLKTIYEQWNH